MPVDARELKVHIEELLKGEDLTNLSLRGVREKLTQEPYNISREEVVANKLEIRDIVNELLPAAMKSVEAEDPNMGNALARSEQEHRRPEPEEAPAKRMKGKGSKGDKGSGKGGKGDGKGGDRTAVANVGFSRQRFLDHAPKELVCKIDGCDQPLRLSSREFSTASCGWFGNQKIIVTVDGEPIRCVAQVTLTAVGSKEWM